MNNNVLVIRVLLAAVSQSTDLDLLGISSANGGIESPTRRHSDYIHLLLCLQLLAFRTSTIAFWIVHVSNTKYALWVLTASR
jgi:hypothetical protein